MGSDGIFVVNAIILGSGVLHLVNMDDGADRITDFFHIIAKGEEEWYLMLNRTEVESSKHPKAKEILKSVKEIGEFLAKKHR